jgi:hypothetical protein
VHVLKYWKYLTGRKQTDWYNDNIRWLLVKSTHTFAPGNRFVSNIVADELAATGYSRKDCTGRSIVEASDGSDDVYLKASNPSWTGLVDNGTKIGGYYLYRLGTNDGDSELVAFDGPPDSDNNTPDGEFEIQLPGGNAMVW